MTTKSAAPTDHYFAPRVLPWWVGGGGLAVFLITLNHWISLTSLGTVARISGWQWQPEIGRPLTLAIFAPFQLLSEPWLPLALNLATAVCAAFVLVQLARSVAILRHDVASADPMREKTSGPPLLTGSWAWLPPVFAALVCGLQLGFWEHATAASGEMLSLLCFAYALRCLLEFRLDPQQKWLARCVLVFAMGMTDNWLMVGYLPALVAGVIWGKGYTACLNLRFLGRMIVWALLGLSLYLLIPTWLSVTAPDRWEFWPTLKAQLSVQKNALQVFRLSAFRLLAITALLPFLLLAVRWRSHTVQLADDSRFGVFFAKTTGHIIHGLFFVTALWIAFDPAISPRQLELKSPLLLYHYPWAMVAGYCAGYLLLFGAPRGSRRPVRWPAFAALVLLVLLPATLIWKNFRDIRLTNGNALREFARQLYEDLPAGNVAVLSDEPRPLFLLRAELATREREKNPLLIDTRSLPAREYHRRMARDCGSRWPDVWSSNRVESLGPAKLLAGVRQIAKRESVVYLHPSSGLFYEDFFAVSHGWMQRLEPRTKVDSLSRTPGDAPLDNEQLWQQRWTGQLAERAGQFAACRDRSVRWARPPLKSVKLASRVNDTAALLAGAYSKTLNHWGVQMARSGRGTEAAVWFERAIALEPKNLTACLNLEYANRRQRGETNRLTLAWVKEQFPHLLGKDETWMEIVSRDGPVDEPTFLLQTGRMYLAAGHLRQALEAFARGSELLPHWFAPKLGQAHCQSLLGNFASTLALLEEGPPTEAPLSGSALAQLLQLRVTALRQTGQASAATAYLEEFAATHQHETEVLVAAAELHSNARQFQAGLKWWATLVQREPDRVDWLEKKGQVELRLDPGAATNTLTRVLTLAPTNSNARLFRAIAALKSGDLEGARADYQELLRQQEHLPGAWFGLGGIAWRERDTNALIQYYQTFLSNNPAASPQTTLARQRLKEWQDE